MSGALQINKFSLRTLSDHIDKESSPVICVIGKRNSGKSQVVRSLLRALKYIPAGIVISPSESGNAFYSTFCPDSFIHHEYDPKVLERILLRQKKNIKAHGKIPANNFFIVLDDTMFNAKQICADVSIREIFRNGRHFQITLIITMQYVMDIPIALRSNIDLVFCMRENNLANLDRLHKAFFGIMPKNLFVQAFNMITEDYGAIVVDVLSRSNQISECVFWYRAPYPSPPFRVGSDELWKFHDSFHAQDVNKETDSIDLKTDIVTDP
jgi:Poxvirus A32 protein